MSDYLKKMKERWQKFRKDHKKGGEMLEDSARMAGAGAVTAGLGYGAMNLLGLTAIGTGSVLTGGAAFVGVASISAVLAGGGFILGAPLVAGAAGVQCWRETRANRKVETVKNAAGQTVQGPHWALERMSQAQAEIIGLTDTFNKEATLGPDIRQKIDAIIANTAEAQKEIVVADPGRNGASRDRYQFVRVRKDTDLL